MLADIIRKMANVVVEETIPDYTNIIVNGNFESGFTNFIQESSYDWFPLELDTTTKFSGTQSVGAVNSSYTHTLMTDFHALTSGHKYYFRVKVKTNGGIGMGLTTVSTGAIDNMVSLTDTSGTWITKSIIVTAPSSANYRFAMVKLMSGTYINIDDVMAVDITSFSGGQQTTAWCDANLTYK